MAHDSALLQALKIQAKDSVDEVSTPWDEIPGSIAEGTLFSLIALLYEEDSEMPISRVAKRLGFTNDDGELE